MPFLIRNHLKFTLLYSLICIEILQGELHSFTSLFGISTSTLFLLIIGDSSPLAFLINSDKLRVRLPLPATTSSGNCLFSIENVESIIETVENNVIAASPFG